MKNIKLLFFKFSPIDLLIILYQMTKYEAPSCNTFRDIMITNFQSPNLQREIIRKKYNNFFFNPSLAFRGFCRASEYPQPLLVAANAGVYIASIWEGNPARDNGSVNPRLYNVYHMALKCAFQKFLVIV